MTAASGNPCECLNWKEVYASKRAECGEGAEFVLKGMSPWDLLFYRREGKNAFIYHEFCTSFYLEMNNNYCPLVKFYAYGNTEVGSLGSRGANWCYVSDKCKDLNGGRKLAGKTRQWDVAAQKPKDVALKRDLSWKICRPGRDKILGELKPVQLLNLANEMGSVTGYVTKIAYPRLMPQVATWDKVRAAFRAGDFGRLPAPLRAAIDAGDPIVVDHDPEGHGAQALIWGPDDIFHLEHSGDKTRKKPPSCKGLLGYQIFCWHHEKLKRRSEF